MRFRRSSASSSGSSSKRILPVDPTTTPVGSKKLSPAKTPHNKLFSESCKRYQTPDEVWAALMTGDVQLIRMTWLIRRYQKGLMKWLPRRQDLPASAFVSVEELQELYGAGNEHNVLPIIAISYCWLTQGHPDPDGDQLMTIAQAFMSERPKYAAFGFKEMGVFWDWMSLYQRDNRLWKPFMARSDLQPEQLAQKEAYLSSRSDEEDASVRRALTQTMDLWYAHSGTCVYLLTELPGRFARARELRPVGLDDVRAQLRRADQGVRPRLCRLPPRAGARAGQGRRHRARAGQAQEARVGGAQAQRRAPLADRPRRL